MTQIPSDKLKMIDSESKMEIAPWEKQKEREGERECVCPRMILGACMGTSNANPRLMLTLAASWRPCTVGAHVCESSADREGGLNPSFS